MIFITENSVQEVKNWIFAGREIHGLSTDGANYFHEGLNPLFFLEHSENEKDSSPLLYDNIVRQIEKHGDYFDLREIQTKKS
ncbi:MAG: hypothetical protein IK094_08770 [Treponema sp.]|nr:hypothetical protein [Treponema sp.]